MGVSLGQNSSLVLCIFLTSLTVIPIILSNGRFPSIRAYSTTTKKTKAVEQYRLDYYTLLVFQLQ